MAKKNPVGPKPRPPKSQGGGVNDKPIPSGKKNRPQYWRVMLVDDEGRGYEGTGPTQQSATQNARQFAIKRRQDQGLPPPPPANQMIQYPSQITDGPHPRF